MTENQNCMKKISEFYDKFNGDKQKIYQSMADYQLIECTICFEEKTLDEFYSLNCPSGHRFCRVCLIQDVEVNINNGSVWLLLFLIVRNSLNII
jgi:hypothetical protein